MTPSSDPGPLAQATGASDWVTAAEWPEKVASLTADGWWLSDLCALDTVGLYAPQGRHADFGPLAQAPGADALDTVGLHGSDIRFEVVTNWLHRERKERLTIHVPAEGDPPSVPSIVETWPTAAFMEREAFDLMGIVFEGHRKLSRLMMPDEWEGHPLRKDYGVGKIPIQWIAQPVMQVDAPGQAPDSIAAGQTVDRLGQSPRETGEGR